jgi:hypothetical protein
MTRQRKPARLARARLHLEALEERTLLSVNLVANFESSTSLANYKTVFHYFPSADIAAAAAHDGLVGLDKHDGYEWMVSTDAAEQVHQGETISAWVQLAGTADGRAYLGFGTTAPTATQDTSNFKALALVMAANTNQLLLQSITGNDTFTNLGSPTNQTYQADHWYRLEVVWQTGGSITGNLYDSDGTTLLSSVTGSNTTITTGNLGIRAFGSDKYFDSYVVDTDSTATPAQLANAGGGLDPNWMYETPPAAPTNGPAGGAVPLPWAYTSVPGTGRDIQLDEWDSFAQSGTPIGDQVVISGQNLSHNVGTVGVDWGPGIQSAGSPATPQLAQYIFRMLPGQLTTLISTSSVKHFFAPSILDPTGTDAYSSGLNASPGLFTYGSELNPVTGELYRPSDIGNIDVNGINQYTRATPNPLDVLPHVAIADLDPAQNPAGTRWFAMGNIYVEGDQNVANNSRWIEIFPTYNASTQRFTITTRTGDAGTLDFHTIPNLAQPAAGPYVASQTPPRGSSTFNPVSDIVVTFDRPVNATTFNTTSINSFTRTTGSTSTDLSGAVLAVNPVGSDGRQFDISFQAQTAAGLYDLNFGPNILDLSGNPMDQDQDGIAGESTDTYDALFSIQGPAITSSSPSGSLFGPVGSVRVTFNEPVNPSTFGTGQIASFTQTAGGNASDLTSALQAVTPVAGSNNTQFDITFATQGGLGVYSLVIAPGILDQNGNPTTASYAASFTIQGLRVTQAALNSTLPGQAYDIHLTFNEPVDFARSRHGTLTFTDPDGNVHRAIGVVPSANYTQFDVLFAPLTEAGSYTLALGPDVYDVYGNPMDQDGNLVPGESTDVFTTTLTLTGPQIASVTPPSSGPLDHVLVTFDRSMDPSTVSAASFALTGPGGPIAITDAAAVPYTNDTQFLVDFAASSATGTYMLTVHAGVADAFGNVLAADVTRSFSIQISYTATATTYQSHDIFGQTGTQTLTFTSGAVTADDDYGTINLGAGNSFNFYGTSYSQLYVSSNGTISFGSGFSDYHPTNLVTGPSQAAIAVYWTDLIKTGTEPMIVYQISNNQLTIEWYNVTTYPSGSSAAMTFEAVLDLNTAGATGDILLNYDSVTGVGADDVSGGITVGVKAAGTGATVANTVVQDGSTGGHGDPRIVSGHAILVHAN